MHVYIQREEETKKKTEGHEDERRGVAVGGKGDRTERGARREERKRVARGREGHRGRILERPKMIGILGE